MNQSKMWLYFILLLVGGRPSWNLYQSCHKMYGAFSDWFLHIASWMEGHWLYLWLEERAAKRRKRGAERLEGRKFKKSEIKRYFYLFGEKAASQTEGEPEERKKNTHTHQIQNLLWYCDPYKQSAYKSPNSMYKKVINVLFYFDSWATLTFTILMCSLILIQMLMSARQAAAPGTSLRLSIRINHERRVVVVVLLQTAWEQKQSRGQTEGPGWFYLETRHTKRLVADERGCVAWLSWPSSDSLSCCCTSASFQHTNRALTFPFWDGLVYLGA